MSEFSFRSAHHIRWPKNTMKMKKKAIKKDKERNMRMKRLGTPEHGWVDKCLPECLRLQEPGYWLQEAPTGSEAWILAPGACLEFV